MAAKKFIVELDAAERERLNGLISKGKAPAKTILKARILLKADQGEGGPGWLDGQIVEALDTNLTMVSRVREKLVTKGLDVVLARKKRETPPVAPIFDGEAQAKLTALACSEPPEGHARWTIRLLAEHVVERRIVSAAHFNTIGRALKKTTSSRAGSSLRPVPRPAHRRRRPPQDRGRRLAHAPQHPECQGQMAVHNRRRPCEAQKPVSSTLRDSG
jgi:hypothetical protein